MQKTRAAAAATLFLFPALQFLPRVSAQNTIVLPRPSETGVPLTPALLSPPDRLKVFSRTPIAIAPFGFFGTPQCNAAHTMFFESAVPPRHDATYLALSSDGQKQTAYELPKEVLESSHNTLFYAEENGAVDLLVEVPGTSLRWFRFEDDGRLAGVVPLPVPAEIRPLRFAVNTEGDLLLMAFRPPVEEESSKGARTFRTIFNASGSELASLAPAPQKLNRSGLVNDNEIAPVRASGTDFYWIEDDTLHVVNSSGEAQRTLALRKPSPSSYAGGFLVSGGVIAITYFTPVKSAVLENRYALMNAATGDLYGIYAAPQGAPMQLACFDAREGLIFLEYDKGHLNLVQASMP